MSSRPALACSATATPSVSSAAAVFCSDTTSKKRFATWGPKASRRTEAASRGSR
ncbi:MAG: hypothetical protein IPJ65_21790 [Archangiaceae bacterium]|nr:hypothetical protein [Archangiaceae bacterium]